MKKRNKKLKKKEKKEEKKVKDSDYEDIFAEGGEVKDDEWKAIVSKFLNEFYGDYENDTWEDYVDRDSVESIQTKYKPSGRYDREVSFEEAYQTFKSSLTPKELKSIEVSFDEGEYADAEEHDKDKNWSSITIRKVGTYAKGGEIGMTKEEKIKELEEVREFLKNSTDEEDIEQAKLYIEELEDEIMYNYGLGGYMIAGGVGAYYGAKNPKSVRKVTDPIDKAVSDIGKNLTDKKSFSKGGSVEFTDISDNTQPYKTWEGKTSKNNKQKSVGAFSHNIKGRYVGDYYLYMLNDWDQDYYSHLPLKNGEILMRIETERMVGGEMPLIKINVDKGWVYFMSDENNLNSDEDDKNPKFNTRTADVNYLSLDKNIQKDITRYAKGGSVYSRFNLTKSELKEKEELKKVVSKSFDWYTYKKGKSWTSSDTKKLAEKLSQNIKSLKEFPQVLNRVNIREFIDELEGYSVPKNKGINYVTESLYSYFMKGEGYAKGGKTYKPGDEVDIKITEYQKTDDDGYHTNYLEVYQHPTKGVWITSENGGGDIVEHSKGKKGKKEVEDFIKRNDWQLVKENVAGTIELEEWDFEEYAKGGKVLTLLTLKDFQGTSNSGDYDEEIYDKIKDRKGTALCIRLKKN